MKTNMSLPHTRKKFFQKHAKHVLVVGAKGKAKWISWQQLLTKKPPAVANEIAFTRAYEMKLDPALKADTKVTPYTILILIRLHELLLEAHTQH